MKHENKPQPQVAFTPALTAARQDLLKYLESSCFLVLSHDGYWGRGATAEAAGRVCVQQGASRTASASVLLILGDETAEVTEAGHILREAGSHNITVLSRIRLGAIIAKK